MYALWYLCGVYGTVILKPYHHHGLLLCFFVALAYNCYGQLFLVYTPYPDWFGCTTLEHEEVRCHSCLGGNGWHDVAHMYYMPCILPHTHHTIQHTHTQDMHIDKAIPHHSIFTHTKNAVSIHNLLNNSP
ncbi:hypothetical protein EON63_10330 [archaeon]|nr:MAG: hypothetical protein EON63_10330 [archaeon]